MKLSVELDSHILWETPYSLGPFKNERGEIDSLLWAHDAGGPPEVLPGRTNERITVPLLKRLQRCRSSLRAMTKPDILLKSLR